MHECGTLDWKGSGRRERERERERDAQAPAPGMAITRLKSGISDGLQSILTVFACTSISICHAICGATGCLSVWAVCRTGLGSGIVLNPKCTVLSEKAKTRLRELASRPEGGRARDHATLVFAF